MSKCTFNNEQFIAAVSSQKSLAGVMRELGLTPAGGNYHSIKRKIIEMNLDTSHFTGKAWIPRGTEIKPFEKLTHIGTIKKRLISERGHQCECCQKSMWLAGAITLEIDHISGNRFDNSRENLRLLCPNCHSLTPTYRGKNIKLQSLNSANQNLANEATLCLAKPHRNKLCTEANSIDSQKEKFINYCKECGVIVKGKGKTGLCITCSHTASRKVTRPPIDLLIKELQDTSYLATGKRYGVSDNAIRKWLKVEKIDPKTLKPLNQST